MVVCIEISYADVVHTAVHGGARLCYTIRQGKKGAGPTSQCGLRVSMCCGLHHVIACFTMKRQFRLPCSCDITVAEVRRTLPVCGLSSTLAPQHFTHAAGCLA